MTRILIVDDDLAHARKIERTLDDMGIKRLHAASAEEAVEIARQTRIRTYRVVSSFTLNATAAGTVNVQMSKGGVPAASAKAGATLAAAGDLATVSIADYVTVVGGIGGSYATLTLAPDAAAGIESATVLIERVCG